MIFSLIFSLGASILGFIIQNLLAGEARRIQQQQITQQYNSSLKKIQAEEVNQKSSIDTFANASGLRVQNLVSQQSSNNFNIARRNLKQQRERAETISEFNQLQQTINSTLRLANSVINTVSTYNIDQARSINQELSVNDNETLQEIAQKQSSTPQSPVAPLTPQQIRRAVVNTSISSHLNTGLF